MAGLAFYNRPDNQRERECCIYAEDLAAIGTTIGL
jgi:hypothetical protein